MNIIFHADDFGITEDQSRQILDCADRGVLNSLSIMPNSERAEACVRLLAGRDISISAHLNLTEGKPVLPAERVPLLVDEKGYFCLSFAKLFLKSLAGENSDFAKQVRDELTAQAHRVRGLFPEGTAVNLDSHQHIHMIPLLFRMTLGLAENTPGVRIRLTSEPVGPFLKKPRFYRTYRLINWVKVFLLKTFAASNRKRLKKRGMDAPGKGMKLAEMLARPGISYHDLAEADREILSLDDDVTLQIETNIKYAGYIEKQQKQVASAAGLNKKKIPADIDYRQISGLRLEARAKLSDVRPQNVGQASRISGVSPADISVLLVYLAGRGAQ